LLSVSLAESFWKNEQTGETRVNWFIGIVTAGSGGLIALANAQHGPKGEPLRLIVIMCLFGLSIFGLVTLLRMVKRNETTDGYKHDMDSIRQLFKDNFDLAHTLTNYQPFRANESTLSADPINRQSPSNIIRKLGGLTHTVAAINSVLLGGLAGAIAFPASVLMKAGRDVTFVDLEWTYGFALAALTLAWCLQVAFISLRESETKKKLAANRITHAGGLVYRLENGCAKYLLVGPKVDVQDEWLLPKGHVEKGEEHSAAALREVREETGVAARLLGFVGSTQFTTGKEPVHVKYYLMQRLFETKRSESRRICWFAFEDALEKLPHDQNKRLLCEAERQRAASQARIYTRP
jgi:8-oxo-dGTP pyrophosphatase MutT (NUDIX family)